MIFRGGIDMSYPKDLLSTRAVVKPGLWAVIPKTGLVNNVIPNIIGGKVSIVLFCIEMMAES